MKTGTAWAVQSFCICFLFNLALGALIFFMAEKGLEAMNDWVTPLTGSGAPALPEEVHTVLAGFGSFAGEAKTYLLPMVAALTLAITSLLWLFVFLAGGRQIRKAGGRPPLQLEPEAGGQGPKVPEENAGAADA